MQLSQGIIVSSASQSPKLPVTPAEVEFRHQLYEQRILHPVDGGNQRVPPNEVDGAISALTRQWIADLVTRPHTGIQLDPMGQLYVAAGQDELAKQQFAQRLATPGLSAQDKAYSLLTAVNAFISDDSGARMQQALEFQAQLDALPEPMITYQYNGHLALGRSYYFADRRTEAISHLRRAVELTARMPYERRKPVFENNPLVMLADLVIDAPNGRASIDELAAFLLPLTTPDPSMAGRDLGYMHSPKYYRELLDDTIRLVGHLGREAPAIVATHWFNTTPPAAMASEHNVPAARQKSLGGKPNLIVFTRMSADDCLSGVFALDRIGSVTPAADVWFVTSTEGAWGMTPVAPDEEAGHLKHYFVERKRVAASIALWAPPKERTRWGGMLPRENPSAAYSRGTVFVMVDQKGIVRHIVKGYTPKTEPLLQSRLNRIVGQT